jgi:mono/diheme cytochrome c family protein
MATAVFLGFFIILGLSVVLVALRGGPRGVRDTLEVGRRRPLHAAEFAVAGAIALFGIAVPVLVLTGDQASAGPGGSTLAANQKEGRELFNQKCATCHTLKDANAVGKVGPNLDDKLGPLGPQGAALVLGAIHDGRPVASPTTKTSNGQMPAQLLQDQDAKKVAQYLVDVAGR